MGKTIGQEATGKLLQQVFFFFFLAMPHGRRDPRSGIKPMPPAVEAQSLNHCTTREAPIAAVLIAWTRVMEKECRCGYSPGTILTGRRKDG